MNYRHYVEQVLIPKFFFQDPDELITKIRENGNEYVFFFYFKCSRMFNEFIDEFPDSYEITSIRDNLLKITYHRDNPEEEDFLSLYLHNGAKKKEIIATEYSALSRHALLAYTLKEGENSFLGQMKDEEEILSLLQD